VALAHLRFFAGHRRPEGVGQPGWVGPGGQAERDRNYFQTREGKGRAMNGKQHALIGAGIYLGVNYFLGFVPSTPAPLALGGTGEGKASGCAP